MVYHITDIIKQCMLPTVGRVCYDMISLYCGVHVRIETSTVSANFAAPNLQCLLWFCNVSSSLPDRQWQAYALTGYWLLQLN
jgi:hypothetical protein